MRAWLETRPRALEGDVAPEGLTRAKIDVLLEAYTGPIRLLSGYRESIPLWLESFDHLADGLRRPDRLRSPDGRNPHPSFGLSHPSTLELTLGRLRHCSVYNPKLTNFHGRLRHCPMRNLKLTSSQGHNHTIRMA
jgi:hypothetical protein